MSSEIFWAAVKGWEREEMKPTDKNNEAYEYVMAVKKDGSIPAGPNPVRKVFSLIYSFSCNIWPNRPLLGLT